MVRLRFINAKALIDQKAKRYYRGKVGQYLDSNLAALDALMISPLPDDRAAKDVQQMRDYAYRARHFMNLAEQEWENTYEDALAALLTELRLHTSYAYLERGPHGPLLSDEDLAKQHGRWKAQGAPDLTPLEVWFKKFEIET